MTESMRDRFTHVVGDILDTDERAVVVLAVISRRLFVEAGVEARHPNRIVDVGIREQAQLGVAAGLALAGYRPIVSGYAPFLVERAFEQVKLDFDHQGTSAILASVGGSWDAAGSGRTHQAPEDVAVISSLRNWDIRIPGSADELDSLLRGAYDSGRRTYIRMTSEANRSALVAGRESNAVLRVGSATAPTILAVGPAADDVLAAVADLDMTVLYTNTPFPLDAGFIRANVTGHDLVLIEPYLAGTTIPEVTKALSDRPMRYHSHGVRDIDLRRFGSPVQHKRAHKLDAGGIRAVVTEMV